MLEEILKVFIERDLDAGLLGGLRHFVEQRAIFIAHGDQVRLGVVFENIDHAFAACRAKYANFYFF